MGAVERRRFRFSVRSLMIAVAVSALALVPFVWVNRRAALLRAQVMRALDAERMARAQAQRAQYAAQVNAAQTLFRVKAVGSAARPEDGSPAERQGGLWAALAVNHAALRRGGAKELFVEFTLVNDGPATVDPKIGESRIMINGAELPDSGLILGNGPRDDRFSALPPGECLRFGYALGDHFPEPGVYRVEWRGANFRSPEVMVRILPEEAK